MRVTRNLLGRRGWLASKQYENYRLWVWRNANFSTFSSCLLQNNVESAKGGSTGPTFDKRKCPFGCMAGQYIYIYTDTWSPWHYPLSLSLSLFLSPSLTSVSPSFSVLELDRWIERELGEEGEGGKNVCAGNLKFFFVFPPSPPSPPSPTPLRLGSPPAKWD